ncbi:NAD(P)-dependent oxidoreductase [Agrobacterium sp. T29]|uniref:NAD(P)-dependent oxidoreductase n=1 Tax=Agrobacterium sp. T29 TaxID=2580515 RepID=UPI00115C4774|nr:NAD(P)-dependent oxidoreductase [Agrobacterium sp. T29]
MRILIFTPTDPLPLFQAITQHTGAEPVAISSLEELVQKLPTAEGLVIGSGTYRQIVPEIRKTAAMLKWIQLSAAGYEAYQDLGAPEGVLVMRAAGVWGRSVAGHALALLMALLRRLPDAERARQSSKWTRSDTQPNLLSLPGLRVLLLGHGDIGATLAPVLRLLGAQVTVVARTGRQDASVHIQPISELDCYLPEAEIVIMTLPLNAQTDRLLDRSRLAALPQGAFVINVGRGELVDEAALFDLLATGHLGGAGLDVFIREPLDASSPLWSLENVVLTPHTAAFGDRESLYRLGELVVENIGLIASGHEPKGLVGVGDSGRTLIHSKNT